MDLFIAVVVAKVVVRSNKPNSSPLEVVIVIHQMDIQASIIYKVLVL